LDGGLQSFAAHNAATMQNPGKSLSLNAFVASIEVVYQQSGTSTDVTLGISA
jgi:hypothetical protein